MPANTGSIPISGLRSFRIRADRPHVELSMTSACGREFVLELPRQCLQSLLMTPPAMIEQSLQAETSDPNLRHVFPLVDWQLELAGDHKTILITLATAEGFRVTFSAAAAEARGLAGDLASGTSNLAEVHLPPGMVRH